MFAAMSLKGGPRRAAWSPALRTQQDVILIPVGVAFAERFVFPRAMAMVVESLAEIFNISTQSRAARRGIQKPFTGIELLNECAQTLEQGMVALDGVSDTQFVAPGRLLQFVAPAPEQV